MNNLSIKILSLILLLQSSSHGAVTFNIIDPNNIQTNDPSAYGAFQAATNYWSSQLDDNVTVNFTIGFNNLGGSTLAQAGSTSTPISASAYLNALRSDSNSADDTTAIANLPTLSGGALTFRTQTEAHNGDATIRIDNDSSNNNMFLSLNTSLARAIGITRDALGRSTTVASDIDITFNSNFSWDYDQSDGIGAGLQDFVGVAVHEIGHGLGFRSGVDTVAAQYTRFNNGQSTNDLSTFAVFTGWDLFRYSADGVLDFSVGTDSYASIDEGLTSLALLSTGREAGLGGDGQQASHWKDNLGIGIFDPTANPPGNINTVSTTDLRALDVMGWDLATSVPEPSTFLFAFTGFGALMLRRQRA